MLHCFVILNFCSIKGNITIIIETTKIIYGKLKINLLTLTIVFTNYVYIVLAESTSILLKLANFSIESYFAIIGSLNLLMTTLFLIQLILLSFIRNVDGTKLYFSYSLSSLSRTKLPKCGTSHVTVLFLSIFLKKCVTNLANVAISLTTVAVVTYLFVIDASCNISAAATYLAISY